MYGEMESVHPFEIDVSEERHLLFVCEHGNNRIQCLTLNLTFIHLSLLLSNIKLTTQNIVVLTEENSYFILQSFQPADS